MKTTIHIPDSLFDEARNLAQQEGTTLKALVEQGLRQVIAERKKPQSFHLRDATFKGEGLQPQVAEATWEQIRDMAYEDRGG